MAKVAPTSIKYMIVVDFEADGVVDKPDVIGAVFGQTEGLLGEDLELRELQKSGRIGRIEVELEVSDSKTKGKVFVPSSLDKVETALVAAAIETICRIGPCQAKFKLNRIEDMRIRKRSYIVDRAKKILKEMSERIPPSQEIIKEVEETIREGELIEYGPDRLPAGPAVEESDEIIIVEGRADVINMLKNGFKNVIGIEGTSIPESIVDLCNRKRTILFVDGDRGGELVAKSLLSKTKVDYIARAPSGKEVEELTSKEIHKCLKSKITSSEFLKKRRTFDYEGFMQEVRGTGGALILNRNLKLIAKIPIEEIQNVLAQMKDASILILDGVVNRNLYEICRELRIKTIVARGSRIKEIKGFPKVIVVK